jgi:hypothetical protein
MTTYVRDHLKFEVEDCGALVNDPQDGLIAARESGTLPPSIEWMET